MVVVVVISMTVCFIDWYFDDYSISVVTSVMLMTCVHYDILLLTIITGDDINIIICY